MNRALSPVALFLLTAAATAFACHGRTPPVVGRSDPAPVVAAVASAPPAPPAPSDGSGASAEAMGAITTIQYAADGTLVVVREHGVEAYDAGGAVRRVAVVAPRAVVAVSRLMDGVAVEAGGTVRLFATPSLKLLVEAPGRIADAATPLVLRAGHGGAASFAHAGALVTVEPPPRSEARDAVSVAVVAARTRAIVSWRGDDASQTKGALYSLPSGAYLGEVAPAPVDSFLPPTAIALGSAQYALEDDRLVVRDLTTARTVRAQRLVCRSELGMANLTVSPDGALILYTCGGDGVVLDGKTLAKIRSIPAIVPGCDNGMILGGRFDGDGPGYVVDGCGGEARVNLRSGRYSCGDVAELLGAPYDMGGGGAPRRLLPDRVGLPRCTSAGAAPASPLGGSDRYFVRYETRSAILDGSRPLFELEEGAATPALSADETRVAYELADAIVVRELPSGRVLIREGAPSSH